MCVCVCVSKLNKVLFVPIQENQNARTWGQREEETEECKKSATDQKGRRSNRKNTGMGDSHEQLSEGRARL